jgi:oxygen-dependent protoporphyrinogen oxidase
MCCSSVDLGVCARALPRCLQPNWYVHSMSTIYKVDYRQIEDLRLTDSLLTTAKDSEAAQNRYIYYPDRLNQLPGAGGSILPRLLMLASSGILNGTWNLLGEIFQPKRPDGLVDESVASFISRRIDKRVADNLISPVLHGIYAGDIEQLSAKTLFSMLWQLEGKYDSILRGWPKVNLDSSRSEYLTLWHPDVWEEYLAMKQHININENLLQKLSPEEVSTFTFKEGLQLLPRKLEEALRASGVQIKTSSPVKSFTKATDGSGQIEVVAGVRITMSMHMVCYADILSERQFTYAAQI